MNQPDELAAKINTELSTHAFKDLISRVENAQKTLSKSTVENQELLVAAAELPSLLSAEIEYVTQEIETEKLVTVEITNLIAKRRQKELEALNELEEKDCELKKKFAEVQQLRINALQRLEEKSRILATFTKSGGLTPEQEAARMSLALLSHLPVNITDTESTVEDNWQKIGTLVKFCEEPHVPIIQKFPVVQQFLATKAEI